MSQVVKVSELGDYLYCPRKTYYHAKYGAPETNIDTVHLVLREMAYGSFNLKDVEEGSLSLGARRLFNEAVENISSIYSIKGVTSGDLEAVEAEINIDYITEGLTVYHQKLACLHEVSVDFQVRSDRLGLTGRLDKLLFFGETSKETAPCIIRTSHPPERGVWKPDRIQIAAFSMLLHERFGTAVDEGFVEYMRHGALRSVRITPADRRQTLQIRDRIRKLYEGKLPEKVVGKKCDTCTFEEKCSVQGNPLMSRFF